MIYRKVHEGHKIYKYMITIMICVSKEKHFSSLSIDINESPIKNRRFEVSKKMCSFNVRQIYFEEEL